MTEKTHTLSRLGPQFFHENRQSENVLYIEGLVKSMLWIYGGWRLEIFALYYIMSCPTNEYCKYLENLITLSCKMLYNRDEYREVRLCHLQPIHLNKQAYLTLLQT